MNVYVHESFIKIRKCRQINKQLNIKHFLSQSGGTGKAPGCLPKYDEMPAPNTMCVYEDEPTVYEFGIPADQIDFIVEKHNEYRGEENAQDMVKMVSV